MNFPDYRLKIFFCFILVYLLLQMLDIPIPATEVRAPINSPINSLTAEYFFFSAFADNSGTVTVLLVAHRSIKVGSKRNEQPNIAPAAWLVLRPRERHRLRPWSCRSETSWPQEQPLAHKRGGKTLNLSLEKNNF